MKQESIQSFYVIGTSAGAGHALSLMHYFKDRVIAGAIIAPTCPTDVEKELGMEKKINPTTYKVRKLLETRVVGDLMAWALSCLSAYQRTSVSPDVKRGLDRLQSEGTGDVVREFYADGDYAVSYTFRGWTDNMRTLNGWRTTSFDLSKIKSKAIIVTAEDDITNPWEMAKWLKNSVSSSVLLQIDNGYGHLFSLLPKNFEIILQAMLTLQRKD